MATICGLWKMFSRTWLSSYSRNHILNKSGHYFILTNKVFLHRTFYMYHNFCMLYVELDFSDVGVTLRLTLPPVSLDRTARWYHEYTGTRLARLLLLLVGHGSVMQAMLWFSNMIYINDSDNRSFKSCLSSRCQEQVADPTHCITAHAQWVKEDNACCGVMTTDAPNLVGSIFKEGEDGNLERKTWLVVIQYYYNSVHYQVFFPTINKSIFFLKNTSIWVTDHL